MKKRNTLINENNAINEEVKYLYQRKHDITTEQQDLRETIRMLKEDLEDLDEKLLRVNLKIN